MASSWTLREPLQEDDPEISALIKREKERQRCGLELIASEVINLMKNMSKFIALLELC